MLQSFFFLHSRTKRVLVWKELIKNGSIDADIISGFVETVSKVVETTFPSDVETGLNEMTMNYGDSFLIFRYGAHVIGVLLVGLESKRFGTILTETVFELEARLAEEFKKDRQVIDVDGARVLFDGGWGLVRASNTQPVLVFRFEARDETRLEQIRQIFMNKFEEKMA